MSNDNLPTPPAEPRITVALLVTCLVDLFRPSVGFASVALLEQAGCQVEVPEAQSCCGQPGYNAGDYASTQLIAQQVIKAFEGYEYVVAPSGSCIGMLVHHYPALFEAGSQWQQRAQALAGRCYELTTFLTEVAGLETLPQNGDGPGIEACYHDSCAGLRELGIKSQPRQLLASCANVTLVEMHDTEVCCGFGGTFCAKLPDISREMVDSKLEHAGQTGASLLLGGDMGCLLHIAGRATRTGRPLQVRHVAEVLANDLSRPAIGQGDVE